MSNNKQDHIVEANKMVTSVEWLVSQQKHNKLFDIETIEQAKAMHKQEVIDANWEASEDTERAEQYYNATFKSE